MKNNIFFIIVGGLLLGWGLMQFDVIVEYFNSVLTILNYQYNMTIIAAFGEIYAKFSSYHYLMLFIALFVICWIIQKFVSFLRG